MERMILRVALTLAANAIALLVAAIVLDKFTIDELDFLWVVIVFTVVSLLTRLAMERLLPRYAPAAVSAVGLITVWLALLITDVVSDDVQIEGIGTWIVATLIVWAATLALEIVPGPWRRARAERADAD